MPAARQRATLIGSSRARITPFITLAGLALMLCGCAAKPFVVTQPSRYSAPGSAYDGQATVYVIRNLRAGPGIRWPVHAQLDGVDEGRSLRRGDFTRFAVPAGQHLITAHWNHLLTAQPDISVSSVFQPGKTYYFSIGTDVGMTNGRTGMASLLNPVAPDHGIQLVKAFHDRSSQ